LVPEEERGRARESGKVPRWTTLPIVPMLSVAVAIFAPARGGWAEPIK
jgi:hypothetical protein